MRPSLINRARPEEALRQTPFVGRTEELRVIDRLIDQAHRGAGSALFIAGEGGLGKTRLVTAAAERAARAEWTVAIGRAYPVETGIPFALFSDALLPLLRKMDSSALSVLTRGSGAELKTIFPSLENISGHRSAAADDASEFKARMLWTFSQLLGKLAEKQPLMLVLENLQWADASSLELLHFVARHAGGQRIVLLATYNSAERDGNAPLRTTEQSLLQIGAATRLQLVPLSPTEVAEFLGKSFDLRTADVEKFAGLLHNWTHGNPFFMEEILKDLTETGKLRVSGESLKGWDHDSLVIPATVREAIELRLQRLSPAAREIGALAATIGTRSTFDTLLDVSDISQDELVAAIDELRAHKLIEEIPGTNPPQYDFIHPLVQQVISSGLGGARASLLHARIAKALEQKYLGNADLHADELAYHYARVLGTDKSAEAIRYLTLAGNSALARYANSEAATYLRAALSRADSEAVKVSPDNLDLILTGFARALQRQGEYTEATQLWTRSRDLAAAAGDRARTAAAEHRIGLAEYWSANPSAALGHLTTAQSQAADTGDDVLLVRIHLARAIVLQDLGRVDEAKSGVEEALIVAERSHDDALLARVHRALLLLYAWTGPKEKARSHGASALKYSAASGQKMLEWTAHWGMAVLSGLSADAPGVSKHLAAAERLNEHLGSPILPIWTAEISIQYLSGTGDWEGALHRGALAIESARAFGQKGILPRLLVWTGLIHMWRGDFDQARVHVDEAWALSRAGSQQMEGDIPSVVPAHHGIASLHLHTRNFAEAISVGEAGLEIADRAGYAAWALQWLLPVVGEAALWAKEWKKAEMHSARMRSDALRLDHPLGLAWADACDGLLIMLRDNNPAGGIHLLRRAAEKMEELQIFASAAVLRRHLGRALIDSDDPDSARKELKRAHDTLARLGARSELEAVREQLRSLGARPPAKVITTGAAGLTGRELEIARMVAERKSNKEIGAALDISARTVSTHLSNIFAKLGVESRGELTDYIRDKGLG
jgi:DNA-binding CsgD family transcriptional regulator